MNRIRKYMYFYTRPLAGLAVFCTAGPVPAARHRPLNPQRDSLYITGSGQVTSAAIETYEKDYYTEEGLKAFRRRKTWQPSTRTRPARPGTERRPQRF